MVVRMSGRGCGVGTATDGGGVTEPVVCGSDRWLRRSPILSLIFAIWLRADLLPVSMSSWSAAMSLLSLSIDCVSAWRSCCALCSAAVSGGGVPGAVASAPAMAPMQAAIVTAAASMAWRLCRGRSLREKRAAAGSGLASPPSAGDRAGELAGSILGSILGSGATEGSPPAGDSGGEWTLGSSLLASALDSALVLSLLSSAMARSANSVHEAVTVFGLPEGYRPKARARYRRPAP